MSWFSDMAGKAEAFLNQMDQAASTSLEEAGMKTPQKSSMNIDSHPTSQTSTVLPYEPTAHASSTKQGEAVAQFLVGSAAATSLLRNQSSSTLSPTQSTSTPKHTPLSPHNSASTYHSTKEKVTNDDLFKFLNSPSKPKSAPPIPRAKAQVSGVRQPSNMSVSQLSKMPRNQSSPVLLQPSVTVPRKEGVGDPINGMEIQGGNVDSKSDVENGHKTSAIPIDTSKDSDRLKLEYNTSDSDLVLEEVDCSQTTVLTETTHPLERSEPTSSAEQLVPVSDHSELEIEVDTLKKDAEDKSEYLGNISLLQTEVVQLKQSVSNYELENKLLKREVTSLNEELVSVMNKLSSHEESANHHESEIHALREQASRTDHMIRQLRSHDEDLQASIEARDSQIQVLRTRFSEADKTVESQQRQMAALRSDKERFLQDAGLSSTAHSHALDSVNAQLTHCQQMLEQECNSHSTSKQEFVERESRLQSELTQVLEALTEQQKQVTVKQSRYADLHTELQRVHNELQLANKEHDDYKLRATGILQAKEKCISSLQSGVGGEMGVANEAKLEAMRLEKEHLQVQLHTTLQQIENLKNDIKESEDGQSMDLEHLTEQVRVCECVLEEERRQHTVTQGEVTKLNQELEEYKECLLREKTTAADLLQRNESELSTLKAQLCSALSPTGVEQETRLRDLTESLIQKQTSLETLNSERNSLSLQLQRLQAQLTETHKNQTGTSVVQTALVMNGIEHADTTSSDTAHIRPMASVLSSLENASTSSRLHNVKQAVNVVDKFSIRLGVFLRRYPHARIFAILYMVLLHVWVMAVLLTYTPETHDANFNSL